MNLDIHILNTIIQNRRRSSISKCMMIQRTIASWNLFKDEDIWTQMCGVKYPHSTRETNVKISCITNAKLQCYISKCMMIQRTIVLSNLFEDETIWTQMCGVKCPHSTRETNVKISCITNAKLQCYISKCMMIQRTIALSNLFKDEAIWTQICGVKYPHSTWETNVKISCITNAKLQCITNAKLQCSNIEGDLRLCLKAQFHKYQKEAKSHGNRALGLQ
jgi:hypothetical protein